ncbi:hypothetical protein EVAR_5370_1 [Eumeta japonica]|uniref:Uncharacterized protein n=1 Tax=Eumeta variegata TaxID=151549 RepID=A0A4C1TNR8_EUMVA|nr:hypothetical protein EVAR_5370_1 [Eumeta japonica]
MADPIRAHLQAASSRNGQNKPSNKYAYIAKITKRWSKVFFSDQKYHIVRGFARIGIELIPSSITSIGLTTHLIHLTLVHNPDTVSDSVPVTLSTLESLPHSISMLVPPLIPLLVPLPIHNTLSDAIPISTVPGKILVPYFNQTVQEANEHTSHQKAGWSSLPMTTPKDSQV